MVDDRTYLTNRLQALLKQYFPQALGWAGELGSLLAIDFLARWPRLEAIQAASPEEVRDFYRSHGCRLGARLPERLAEIVAARPLITDRAVINASIMMLQALLEPLRGLIAGITSFDRQIEASYEQHPDKEVFNSLPGAGPVLAPRLLAAFGADRERYQNAEEIQCFSGIAPVIKRSGKTKFVHRRLACPKFVRQSFHEYAKSSIPWSRWARAYYDQQRRRGNKHHEAVRALAYKWARIIYRCWQDHEPHDEAVYIARLELRGSPLPPAHPGRSRVMSAALISRRGGKSCSEFPRRGCPERREKVSDGKLAQDSPAALSTGSVSLYCCQIAIGKVRLQ